MSVPFIVRGEPRPPLMLRRTAYLCLNQQPRLQVIEPPTVAGTPLRAGCGAGAGQPPAGVEGCARIAAQPGVVTVEEMLHSPRRGQEDLWAPLSTSWQIGECSPLE